MFKYLNKKYKLSKRENYDPYLRTIRYDLFHRKLFSVQKPVIELQEKDGKYVFKTVSISDKSTIVFRPSVPFDEVLLDGSPVKSVIEFEDNKMIYMSYSNDLEWKQVYEFSEKEVNVTITCSDIICTMVYTRENEEWSDIPRGKKYSLNEL